MKRLGSLFFLALLLAMAGCSKAEKNKPVGSACQKDAECAAGFSCVSLKYVLEKCEDQRICTKKDCKTNADCPNGWGCQAQGKGRACFDSAWKDKHCK